MNDSAHKMHGSFGAIFGKIDDRAACQCVEAAAPQHGRLMEHHIWQVEVGFSESLGKSIKTPKAHSFTPLDEVIYAHRP